MAPSSVAPLVIGRATSATRVLLVHAPYPGRLKFEAQPSSLLTAAGALVRDLASEGRLAEIGILDPGASSPAFYAELARLAAAGTLAVVCISASTAAIEEAARIARVVREVAPNEVLVLGGGPHEDDAPEPMAERIPGIDLSVGGDAEGALAALAGAALSGAAVRANLLDARELLERVPLRGAGVVSSAGGRRFRWRGKEGARLEDVASRPWTDKPVHFSVFPGRTTLPLMVSRGCSYGQCSFCAEGGSGGQQALGSFEHLVPLLEAHPGSAIYFQDSIFPSTRAVRERLLPLLRDAGRPWGCQVYLPTLSRAFVQELAAHGCTYAYTGLESGAEALRVAVGKRGLRTALVSERLQWLSGSGLSLGLSLMFGVISDAGELLETERTVAETVRFVEGLVEGRLRVVGVYPNVLTVLPGTRLAQVLGAGGAALDFYRMPRTAEFEDMEDGGVGHNFVTMGLDRAESLSARVAEASKRLSALGGNGSIP